MNSRCPDATSAKKADLYISAMAPNPLDALINLGFHELRPSTGPVEKTVIVLGVARGGTSMVAGALSKLGVYMGDAITGVVFEDLTLSRAVERRDKHQVRQIINDRNQRFRIWGWKRPSSIDYIGNLESEFRNPIYVVVFRDIFSIANRNRLSMSIDVVSNMRRSLAEYLKIIEFLEQSKAPCMLVSYDKAINNKEGFVRYLARFVGIDNEASLRAAIESIQPASVKYLNASRNNRSMGCLDRVSADIVSGWAKWYHPGKDAVKVQLLVNGQELMRTQANEFREDVQMNGKQITGRCGFSFFLPEQSRLQHGDEVRVRVIGDIYDLKNSPYRYAARTVDRSGHPAESAPVKKFLAQMKQRVGRGRTSRMLYRLRNLVPSKHQPTVAVRPQKFHGRDKQ
jgi:hypothetical protein